MPESKESGGVLVTSEVGKKSPCLRMHRTKQERKIHKDFIAGEKGVLCETPLTQFSCTPLRIKSFGCVFFFFWPPFVPVT